MQASGRMAIIPAWAVDDRRLTPSTLRVLLVLGTYSDSEGWAYPSVATIAARADLTRQRAHIAINSLIDLGYIERTNRVRQNGSKTSNLYKILFDSPKKDDTETDTDVRMMSPSGYIPCNPSVTSKDVTSRRLHPERPTSNLPKENDPLPKATPREKGTNPRATGTNPRAQGTNPRAVADVRSAHADRFDSDFWPIYPRKVAKYVARKAWDRLKPGEADSVIAGVLRDRESAQWTKDGGRFIPHPSSYLNQRRWEDEIPAPRTKPEDARPEWL